VLDRPESGRIETGALLGRCRLVREIGKGGMGVVWEARHETLEIPVAVKILRDQGWGAVDASRYRERFQREARIAARLNHPGLVRVLDFGDQDGRAYLVMELVAGNTLEQYLERKSILSEKMSLQVVGHLCSALAVAHGAGILHRDIKPSNVLIDAQGRLKLSDLGLARDLQAPSMTGADSILGTPHYLAPESIERLREPDQRADLYSVGVMLYQMLFGRPLFQGGTAQVLHAHLSSTPDLEPPDGVEISAPTMALLRLLLQKRPDRRIGSAAAVVEACRDALARLEGSRDSVERSGHDSADSRLRRSLTGQFGNASSVQGGKRILHTTGKERVLLWFLLAGIAAAAIASWLAMR
jgi:eukaryotic-like serine/threonine-protein kinase